MRIGYFLSSEEYTPAELLEQARGAERAGFEALWISDHYHPWVDAQGQSPFVWSMIGALSQVCRLPVTTAVTCPTIRIHPAVIAQAAATSGGAARGPVRARHRQRRGAQRAHLRRRVAGRRGAAGDAGGVRRGDAQALEGRVRPPPGHALHSGARAHLHAARGAPADLRLRVRAEGRSTWPPASATATSAPCRTPRWSSGSGTTAAATSPARPASRRRTRDRGGGRARSRTRSGPTPGCPASCPRCCPPPGTSSRPRELVQQGDAQGGVRLRQGRRGALSR